MFRKITLVLFFSLLAVSSFAFDKAELNNCLNDLAAGISQTAYSLSENENSAERASFDSAASRADKSEKKLKEIVSSIETASDFAKAQKVINAFGKKDKLNSHTAAVATKLLKDRARFINSNLGSTITVNNSDKLAVNPEMLMSTRQKRLIMIETPIAEAVISITDKKDKRRVSNLENIFKRHDCRIISEYSNESGDQDVYNYYFEGKKFVLDALMGHFGGTVVKSDLKATVKITSGGFWSGKQTATFDIAPTRSGSVMGDLSWYKSVVEKDPFKYLAEKNFSKLSALGKMENVAGESKLHLKNAIVEIWVMANGSTIKNAIYKNETEFGDLYIDAK